VLFFFFLVFANILMARKTDQQNLLICTGLQAERSNMCVCVCVCVYTESTFKPLYSATLSSLQFVAVY